jgi:hypothetical protein
LKARRIILVTSLLVAVALAAATLWMRYGPHAGPSIHKVELKDGEMVEGLLFPLNDHVYVVQTEDQSVIVDASEIHGVDGEKIRSVPISGDVVIVHQTFEEILPTGEIDVRSSIRHRNTGSKPMRELRWGMGPHELEYLDSYQQLDVFGNTMPVKVVGELPNGGKQVKVDLLRPLFPGEETWYTSHFVYPATSLLQGDVWTYRHMGRYPDSRLVTRSVLLPEGAQILSIEPEPMYKLKTEGRWLVVWRRYFFRDDVTPWEIRFRP